MDRLFKWEGSPHLSHNIMRPRFLHLSAFRSTYFANGNAPTHPVYIAVTTTETAGQGYQRSDGALFVYKHLSGRQPKTATYPHPLSFNKATVHFATTIPSLAITNSNPAAPLLPTSKYSVPNASSANSILSFSLGIASNENLTSCRVTAKGCGEDPSAADL